MPMSRNTRKTFHRMEVAFFLTKAEECPASCLSSKALPPYLLLLRPERALMNSTTPRMTPMIRKYTQLIAAAREYCWSRKTVVI